MPETCVLPIYVVGIRLLYISMNQSKSIKNMFDSKCVPILMLVDCLGFFSV